MRNTLKRRKDFVEIGKQTEAFVSDFFIMRTRPTLFEGDARFGITATKKTFEKSAIKRNRARRLLREWIRLNNDKLNPDLDYVFIARHMILDSTLKSGLKQMERAIKHSNKQ